jgi:hypothetical protein
MNKVKLKIATILLLKSSYIKIIPVLVFSSFFLNGCLNTDDRNKFQMIDINYLFESNEEGWVAGYSDYPAGLTAVDSLDLYEMSYGHSPLPDNIVPDQSGFRIRGHNRSDDLFMYLKREISGLAPATVYRIDFTIELASNAPTNAAGIGGAPGEGVVIKAGAVGFEPKDTIDNNNWYRLNIDKGDQAVAGDDVVILGHVGVADNTNDYTLITRSSPVTLRVQADNNGSLWLIVGTDSGFEGLTELYYSEISVSIQWP